MVTGLNAAVAVLLALNERARSGLGQFLDITLYDCAVSLLHPHAANYFYSGNVPGRTGNAHPNIAPYETRSEEHTSELQSLMRNSYAVFCLKKKNKPTTT